MILDIIYLLGIIILQTIILVISDIYKYIYKYYFVLLLRLVIIYIPWRSHPVDVVSANKPSNKLGSSGLLESSHQQAALSRRRTECRSASLQKDPPPLVLLWETAAHNAAFHGGFSVGAGPHGTGRPSSSPAGGGAFLVSVSPCRARVPRRAGPSSREDRTLPDTPLPVPLPLEFGGEDPPSRKFLLASI